MPVVERMQSYATQDTVEGSWRVPALDKKILGGWSHLFSVHGSDDPREMSVVTDATYLTSFHWYMRLL
jgi:hypothetical protein